MTEKYEYPELLAVVANIAGKDLTEIDIQRIKAECIKIEKEELVRNMKVAQNILESR